MSYYFVKLFQLYRKVVNVSNCGDSNFPPKTPKKKKNCKEFVQQFIASNEERFSRLKIKNEC